MNRQLRKVIFLPANDLVLTDSGYIGPVNLEVINDESFFKPFWRKYFYRKRYKARKQIVPDPWNEANFQGSVWKAIEYCKQFSYEVILFNENEAGLSEVEVFAAFQILKSKGLVVDFINVNLMEDFVRTVEDLNINPHNSIFVSKNPEIFSELIQRYFPANYFRYYKPLTDNPMGFNMLFWKDMKSDLSIPGVESILQLPSKLKDLVKLGAYVYSYADFPFLRDQIIYIEDHFSKTINDFIVSNYSWIEEQAKLKGCGFIYFPRLINDSTFPDFIRDYLRYYHPHCTVIPEITHIHDSETTAFWSNLLLEILNLPSIKSPALIRNRGSVYVTNPNEFSCIPIEQDGSIQDQFENYFKILQPANDKPRIFALRGKPQTDTADAEQYPTCETFKTICPEEYADDKFDEDANVLADDVINKIEYLKSHKEYALLAEIALQMFEGNLLAIQEHLKHTGKTIEIDTSKALLLSRLRIEWTSKFDFDIILSDYGNRIVEMPRLPKALYYFFLKHPEGIMLNSLGDYKEELLVIYSRLSNKSDKQEILRNIERLTDPLDNSVNVNCSRIKSAFVKLIDDTLARNYYITGDRGYPKKITISPEMVEYSN